MYSSGERAFERQKDTWKIRTLWDDYRMEVVLRKGRGTSTPRISELTSKPPSKSRTPQNNEERESYSGWTGHEDLHSLV